MEQSMQDAATFRVDTKLGPVTVRFIGDGQARVFTHEYVSGDLIGDGLTVNRVNYRADGWFHAPGTCRESGHWEPGAKPLPCYDHMARRADDGGRDVDAPPNQEWQYGRLHDGSDAHRKRGEIDVYSRFPDMKRTGGDWTTHDSITDKARTAIKDTLLAVMRQVAAEHPEGMLAGDVVLADTRHRAAVNLADKAVAAMQEAMAAREAAEQNLRAAREAFSRVTVSA